MRTCVNGDCNGTTRYASSRCANCESYYHAHGEERPLRLILWPTHGHPLLTSTGLCKLTGITYRRLDHAVRCGWLRPTVDAEGSGYARGFTLDDAVRTVVGFECAGLPDDLRDHAVRACNHAQRIRLRVGAFSEFVIDVAAIREYVESRWPDDAERDLDEQARAAVLGTEVAA